MDDILQVAKNYSREKHIEFCARGAQSLSKL